MDKRLSYLKISKPVLLIIQLILSILSFTKVNIAYFKNPDDSDAVIWVILITAMIIISVLNIFIGKKILPKSYLIGTLIFSIILFAFSWIETVYLGYDSDSKQILFNCISGVSVIISVLLYTLTFHKKNDKEAESSKAEH